MPGGLQVSPAVESNVLLPTFMGVCGAPLDPEQFHNANAGFWDMLSLPRYQAMRAQIAAQGAPTGEFTALYRSWLIGGNCPAHTRNANLRETAGSIIFTSSPGERYGEWSPLFEEYADIVSSLQSQMPDEPFFEISPSMQQSILILATRLETIAEKAELIDSIIRQRRQPHTRFDEDTVIAAQIELIRRIRPAILKIINMISSPVMESDEIRQSISQAATLFNDPVTYVSLFENQAQSSVVTTNRTWIIRPSLKPENPGELRDIINKILLLASNYGRESNPARVKFFWVNGTGELEISLQNVWLALDPTWESLQEQIRVYTGSAYFSPTSTSGIYIQIPQIENPAASAGKKSGGGGPVNPPPAEGSEMSQAPPSAIAAAPMQSADSEMSNADFPVGYDDLYSIQNVVIGGTAAELQFYATTASLKGADIFARIGAR